MHRLKLWLKLKIPNFFLIQNKNQNSKGFVPGQKKDGVPGASSEYETRLAEARKNGNTLEAIKIKQEAAADGVVLI